MSNNRIESAIENLKDVVEEETGVKPDNIKINKHREHGLNNLFKTSNNFARNYNIKNRDIFMTSVGSLGLSLEKNSTQFTVFGEPEKDKL